MHKNTKKIVLIVSGISIVIVVVALAINNLFGSENSKNISSFAEANNQTENNNLVLESEAKKLLEINNRDIVVGNKNAPVTIIEYASLSCSHCASFYNDSFSKLNSEYIETGKVKFVYRDFPLDQTALVASMIALCQVKDPVTDSKKYYDFIKILFKTQDSWASSKDFTLKLETIAKLNGVSQEQFNECIKNTKLQDEIIKVRLSAAQNLQIQSTPTFFINNEMISGYGGYGDIKKVVEKKIKESTDK